jgi:hypothetical protein
MDEEPIEKYSPKLKPWFSSEISYEGQGSAEFKNPIGRIEGKTTISVNELGDIKVEMEYEHLVGENANAISGNFKFLQFLYRYSSKDGTVIYDTGEEGKNPCSKLTVNAQEGTFVSEGKIYWSSIELQNKLVFWISRGTFEMSQRRQPKYWVVPLTNFISTFHWNLQTRFTKHPLWLYSMPVIPETEDKEKVAKAMFAGMSKSMMIGFDFGGTTGFIQPLPDYGNKKEKLESGKERQCVTALMVGEITKEMDPIWFPYDYTNLLSLASGAKVGAPWLEFRDDEGKLVNRKHFPTYKGGYDKGYAVIEIIHDDFGQLISRASNSPEFGQTYFRILVSHLTELISQHHFETRMTILSRAFEGLFSAMDKLHNIGKTNLMAYLPSQYKAKVKPVLRKASDEIKELYQRSQKDNSTKDTIYSLKRIKDRIDNASNTDKDFGLKVLDLLNFYQMPDAVIMERYYSQLPEGKASWAGFLSSVRNSPLHEGYFAIQDGTFDSDEIINVEDHLHDILVRIALKILEYDREYQPKVIDHLVDGKTRGWVTENISAIDLGYERRRFSNDN